MGVGSTDSKEFSPHFLSNGDWRDCRGGFRNARDVDLKACSGDGKLRVDELLVKPYSIRGGMDIIWTGYSDAHWPVAFSSPTKQAANGSD
jgi:hypothetical protein